LPYFIIQTAAAAPSDDKQHNSYVAALKRKNLTIYKVAGDGNCLFRAVAHQLYRDVERHEDVRNTCMDYMEKNVHLFLGFFDEENSLDTYIAKHRKLGSWGGDHELESMRRCFNLKLEIYIYDATLGASLYQKNINEEEEDEDEDEATKLVITLSYIGNNHYDSIVGQAEVILTHTHSYSLVSLNLLTHLLTHSLLYLLTHCKSK
jgi:OTU domain-containing protein 5